MLRLQRLKKDELKDDSSYWVKGTGIISTGLEIKLNYPKADRFIVYEFEDIATQDVVVNQENDIELVDSEWMIELDLEEDDDD